MPGKRYDRQFKLAAAMLVLEGEIPTRQISEELGVPDNTLRRWPTEYEREALMNFVSEIFNDHKGRYGARRVCLELKKIGIHRNYKHIQSIMREMGLRTKGTTRRYRRSKPVLDSGANLLNREFDVGIRNRARVGDITHILTHQGFLYLAIMLDLHSCKVVGWSTSKRFNRELEECGCIHSYSRKGNPYDNAVMESFYRTLKWELLDKKEKFADRLEVRQEIFKYIELYYNTKRVHSSLGYMSPVDYERANAQKISS